MALAIDGQVHTSLGLLATAERRCHDDAAERNGTVHTDGLAFRSLCKRCHEPHAEAAAGSRVIVGREARSLVGDGDVQSAGALPNLDPHLALAVLEGIRDEFARDQSERGDVGAREREGEPTSSTSARSSVPLGSTPLMPSSNPRRY